MKNIKYFFIASLLTLSLSSCNDWLTILPDNEQITDQFWSSKEDVEGVLANGYVSLRSCAESMLLWGEARGNALSPMWSTTGELYADAYKLSIFTVMPSDGLVSWANYYKVINMANSVLHYTDGIEDNSFKPEERSSYKAEAYFLRALAYFYLVRNFKEVPFVTEPYITDAQPYDMAKSDEATILNSILADLYENLQYAKEVFDETDPLNPIYTKGRATRWAMYALIADINLWMGNYDACITACQSIKDGGRIGLIRPDSENNTAEVQKEIWFSNFYPGNSNESIFEVQYSNSLSQTSIYLEFFSTNSWLAASRHTMTEVFPLSTQELDVRYNLSISNRRIWKYIGNNSIGGTRSSTQNDQNWIVYRMADIYLMMAEALIMKGNTDNYSTAVTEWINPVRNRVGLANATATSNELDMLKLVLYERKREFIGEGKTWYDILRVAKRNEFQYHQFLVEETLKGDMATAGLAGVITSIINDTNALYLPIAQSEINNNKLLVQNKYYEAFGNSN